MSLKKNELLIDGPKSSKKVFLIAHGAGAPMDSDWMNDLTTALVSKKIKVIRFEFPYMQERRKSGSKRPPNPMKILMETFQKIVSDTGSEVFIGGKSMGGRVASLLADQLKVKGLICLGFPFHAPGKDVKDRIDHLKNIKTKTLIIQGERDSMGNKDEIENYNLSKKIKIHFMPDGDHSLKPRKKSGHTLEEHIQLTADLIDKFMN